MNDISEKVEEGVQHQAEYAGLPDALTVKDEPALDPLAIESNGQTVGCDLEENKVRGACSDVKHESSHADQTEDNGVMKEDEIDEDKLLEDTEVTDAVDIKPLEAIVTVSTPPPDVPDLDSKIEPEPFVDENIQGSCEQSQETIENKIVPEETEKKEEITNLDKLSSLELKNDVEEVKKIDSPKLEDSFIKISPIVDTLDKPNLDTKKLTDIEEEKVFTAPEKLPTIPDSATKLLDKSVTIPDKTETIPDKTITLPEKPVTAILNLVTTPENTVTPSLQEDPLTAPEKKLTVPANSATNLDKKDLIPEKPVSILEKPISVPEKKHVALGKTATAPEKIAATTPIKPVSALEKIIAEVENKRSVLEQKNLAAEREEKKQLRAKEKHLVKDRVEENKQEKAVDVEMKEIPLAPVVEMETKEKPRPKSAQPVNGDIAKEEQPIKRRASEDFETENPLKRLCMEVEKTFPQHDAMVNDYIQTATKNNIDELQRHTEQLLSEIQTLRELAQKKEHEWNNILHLKKVKEEILLRLLRRKQVLSFEKSPDLNGPEPGRADPFDYLNQPKNFAIDKSDEISGLSLKQPSSMMNPIMQAPMMPVTSHYNAMTGLPPPYDKTSHMQIPKPPMFPQQLMMPGPGMPAFPRDMNGQMHANYLPMGRQGPTKDVKSIIADYRQRNPDMIPRRGRRMKSVLNPNMINPRPIAPKVDHMNSLNNLNMLFNNLDMNQKAMLERLQQIQAGGLPNGVSFKDVLVQFANMQQNPQMIPNRPPEPINRPEHPVRPERRRQERNHEEASSSSKQTERLASPSPRLPPPPPYPEISLLPVNTPQDPNQASQNSLLHGILTKQAATTSQSYSPTLAKLLTSPERKQSTPTLPTFGQAKNCGEITITPVQPLVAPPPEPQPEKPEEVVQLDDEESPPSEGEPAASPSGSGKLVIDEASGEDAPLCQGCRRKDAQFVCAGCANQWYCSRDCQVAAWDDHSEMCSG